MLSGVLLHEIKPAVPVHMTGDPGASGKFTSGDTLFCTSVGRTDFPGGSMSDIIRSIKEKLMTLPDRTTVYPGHNDVTTIENERMYNPYL